MTGKILIALTKVEADTHWSNGQIQEALKIYRSLLASTPKMTLNTKASIEARIKLLLSEIDKSESPESKRDLNKAIQKLQKAMAGDKTVVKLRKEAKAFYKKGMFADALENLKQLIRLNAADEFCVTAVAGCIVHLHPKHEVAVGADLFLAEAFQNAEKAAHFKIMLANKMSKNGYTEHAQVLQQHQDRFISSGSCF